MEEGKSSLETKGSGKMELIAVKIFLPGKTCIRL